MKKIEEKNKGKIKEIKILEAANIESLAVKINEAFKENDKLKLIDLKNESDGFYGSHVAVLGIESEDVKEKEREEWLEYYIEPGGKTSVKFTSNKPDLINPFRKELKNSLKFEKLKESDDSE